MTDIAASSPTTATIPAGWYPDPGGSAGERWWSGAGWTETVRLPAATPPAPPVAAQPFVLPAPREPAQSRFGGPVEAFEPVAVAPAGPAHRAAQGTTSTSPSLSTRAKILIGLAAVVVVAGCVLWMKLMSGGSTPAPLGGLGGTRGPAAEAAAQIDAQNVAAAEETVYGAKQAYLPFAPSTDIVELDKTVVRLSPQDSASVVLNPSTTGYCVLVVSRSPTTGATATAVYVSTLGGLQPLATSCPAQF